MFVCLRRHILARFMLVQYQFLMIRSNRAWVVMSLQSFFVLWILREDSEVVFPLFFQFRIVLLLDGLLSKKLEQNLPCDFFILSVYLSFSVTNIFFPSFLANKAVHGFIPLPKTIIQTEHSRFDQNSNPAHRFLFSVPITITGTAHTLNVLTLSKKNNFQSSRVIGF